MPKREEVCLCITSPNSLKILRQLHTGSYCFVVNKAIIAVRSICPYAQRAIVNERLPMQPL